MKPILLIIDIQNDYFEGGKMELVNMNKATENAEKLLSYFRKNDLPIVFIQHLAIKPNASFFIPNTWGAEIHDSIYPLLNETVITKNFPNSFRGTNLHQHLQALNSTDLVICGAMSHKCALTLQPGLLPIWVIPVHLFLMLALHAIWHLMIKKYWLPMFKQPIWLH